MVDLDALLRAVPGPSPAGEDLEYTALAELDRVAGVDEPDWARIESACRALLDRTKDLRVAVWYTQAALVQRGLAGLGDGLALVAGLLQAYWPTLHPCLSAEDDHDPVERANVLANLSPDPAQSHPSPRAEAFQRALRDAVVAQARSAGRFTVRDLEQALARGAPSPGVAGAALSTIERARSASDAGERLARAEGVRRALEALAVLDTAFVRETGRGCRLFALQRTLERVHRFLAPADPAAPGTATALLPPSTDEPGGARSDPAMLHALAGPLASREDAVHVLGRVAAFVRASQPSSPAPLFIDRAAALLQMDFADIVRSLMPAARPHIELLGGVSLEAETT